MKKYMVLAKNDFNEEIFYSDIKAEAKHAFDRMLDKYIFVKIFCYSDYSKMYKDITEYEKQTVYKVQRFTGVQAVGVPIEDLIYINEEWKEFTNEVEAMLYIINSMKAGFKCKLYKNTGRDWRV